MPDTEIERRLRNAGTAFIEAHDRAAEAIREASNSRSRSQSVLPPYWTPTSTTTCGRRSQMICS